MTKKRCEAAVVGIADLRQALTAFLRATDGKGPKHRDKAARAYHKLLETIRALPGDLLPWPIEHRLGRFINEAGLLPLPLPAAMLRDLKEFIRDFGGQAADDYSPLTEEHQKSFDLIKRKGPLTGKQIVNQLGLASESVFTRHHVPELKRHGVINKRGLGYLLPPPT